MSVLDDLIKKASESREQSAEQANPFLNGYKANEQKVWSDRHGNVNITDLGTGVTRRHYDSGTLEDVFGLRSVNPNKASPTKDSYLQDTAQALADHLHAQRASYKSALGSAVRGIAGLVHGDNNYQPEVGSWLWRMQEGYEAEKGVSAKLGEDSKYGKGWLHGLAMDLTGGAVDLAGDRVLDLILPGAGLAAMDIRSFGDSAGQSQVQGKSISTQMLNGAIHAAIGHFAEKAGTTVGRGKGTAAWGDRLSSAIESRLEQKGASKLVQKLIIGFGEEATEEMLEDILNPAVSKFVAGIDKGDYDAEEFPSIAEIAYDGLVGGLLGLMGGFTEGVRATKEANASGSNVESDVPVRKPGEANETFANRVKTYLKAKAEEHVDTALEKASSAKHNAESAELPTKPVEAQPPVDQQITPPAPEVAEKAPPVEFNSKLGQEAPSTPDTTAEAAPQTAPVESPVVGEQKKTKPIGKKAARDIAFDAWFADNVRNANQEGVAVDASDFADESAEPSTKEPESAKLEEKPKQTNEERIAKSRESALAQNGIDYGYDPRADLEIDPDTGTYREFEPHDMSEEDWQQYKKDLAQARLLDSVDRWLAKNTDSYLDAEYGTLDQKHERLQKALNNYVRDKIDQRQANPEAGEASMEVAEAKVEEARLKGKQRSQKYTENGYTVIPIGNELFRVTGPGGRTAEVVANSSAEAIQKYNDNLTEESRKAAKERKAKEAELKKMREDVIESGKNPAQVDGSDGNSYEVTKQFSNEQQTRYEYVVTELDEDGLPSDREARVFQNRANTNEEAVQYAIENDLFKEDDYSDLEEGSNDERYAGSIAEGLAGDVSQNIEGDARRQELKGESGNNLRKGSDGSERGTDLGVPQTVQEDLGILRERSATPKEAAEKWLKVLHPDSKAIPEGTDPIADEAYKIGRELGASAVIVCDHLDDGTVAEVKGGVVFFDLDSLKWFIRNEPGGVDVAMIHERLHQYVSARFGRRNEFMTDFESERKAHIGVTAKFSELYNELLAKHGEVAEKAFAAYAFGYNGYEKSAQDVLDLVELAKPFDNAEDRARFLEGYVAEELFVDLAAGAKARIKYNTSISDSEYNALRKSVLESISKEFFNGRDTSDIKALLKQNVQRDLASVPEAEQEPPQPKRSAPPSDLNETLNEMSREREAKEKTKGEAFEKQRAEDKQHTNAKEYAYQKKLEAEQNSEEAKEQAQSDEEKAKSTFGKDYDKVQKSAEDFDKIKTDFDSEEFLKSDKKRDKGVRNKLKRLREAFSNAAKSGDVETLFKEYERLKDDPDLGNFYNEQVQEEIDNWRKLIDENADTYNESASTYAASRTMQMMGHKFKLANEYQQTLKKMNETLSGSKSGMLRKIAKSEKLTSSVARALVRWQINPDTVFKMIDAFDKGNMGEGYKLAKELQTAHRKKYEVLRQARAHFGSINSSKEYNDFAFGRQTVKDYSGREWDMRSALSVIKAIDTIRSTSGKKLGGTDGFGVMDSKGNIEYIKMSDVDALKLYESLKSGLSDVAAKFGDAAVEAFNDVKEPLRKTYYDNNGVEIRMVGDEDQNISENAKKKGIEKAVYSPLSYVTQDGQVYQFDIAKQDTYNNVPRFLRERSENGGTYLLIKPYTDVVDGYFEQVSNYLAYSAYGEKMRGLAKGSSYTPSLAQSLADTFGKDMGNWYQNYVEDLKTYKNEDDTEGVNSLLRQGRQQLQQGALLFSVSVPMKQISSYWAASGILHPDSLIQAYRIKLLKPKNGSDAATMLASRAMGNLEQSAAEAAKDAEKWLGKLKYSSKFIKMAANAINQMDYNTVSNLLTATEYDVLKYQFNNDTSKIGTEEFNQAVEELFQDVVDRSQPNFDKQMRAEYGRTDNEIIRMLSMFRTQQTQNLNLLATAIGEYNAAKGTANAAKATETLKNTIAGQAASAFSLSILTVLADMLLHRQKKYEDDDKELDPTKVLARIGINATEAAAGTMWFGDTVAKWAIDRISGGKTKEFYGVNMGVISTVSDILENFENFMKNPSRSNARYCAGNIATLMGIPLNNAYSMLNSAIMYGKDVLGTNEGDYDDILKYLDAQAKAAKKEEEKAAKAAAKAAEKNGADMLADTAQQKGSQSELNSQEEQKETKPSGYLTKPYNALVEAGMSSQRSQEVLSEMDTDGNNSVKQAEMIAYWKAHPEDEEYVIAMWNSYGYKTTWEAAKKKAG